MTFSELFKDELDREIADDIAPYFKKQTMANLSEFESIGAFFDELNKKVNNNKPND